MAIVARDNTSVKPRSAILDRRIARRTSKEFQLLCKLSPDLREFYGKVQSIRDDGSAPYFCANRVWDGELRDRLDEIVGWNTPEAFDARLRTWQAHNLARHFCFSALPNCRRCGEPTVDELLGARGVRR